MLMGGLGLGVLEVMTPVASRDSIRLVALWMILYGGALHSAGFFMRRGLKLLGCAYVLGGLGILPETVMTSVDWTGRAALADGAAFGWAICLRNLPESDGGTPGNRVNPESFQQLDKVIHEKSRMAIMSMLAASPNYPSPSCGTR